MKGQIKSAIVAGILLGALGRAPQAEASTIDKFVQIKADHWGCARWGL